MKAKELKEKLGTEEIIQLMYHLGADSKPGANDNELLFNTICHHGDSHKLYFYKDSKQFYCYSNCGSLDIINIVQNVLQFNEVSKAINYICELYGLGGYSMEEGFFDEDIYSRDLEVLNYYDENIESKEVDMSREFELIDENILNYFYKYYHPAFYNDGISFKTMHKFGIRYDILNQRIIIPHRDEEGRLIAIRCRNLDQVLIDEGRKYTPIYFNRKLLSAKTSLYLYGLYYNQENIRRSKKVILLEAEKSVMQLDTILNDNNIGVALSSSSLSLVQVELLKSLGVTEVIIAMDKDFKEYGSVEEKKYAMKIRKAIVDKLKPYFVVTIMWDTTGLLGYKDSPTDKGSEVFYKLFNNRIKI